MLAGVSTLVVALGTQAFAQTPAPTGLRLSQDAPDEVSPPAQPRRPLGRPPAPIGRVPTFGSPPAFGAGTTGFDSTNGKRRRKPVPAVILPTPLRIVNPTAPQPLAAAPANQTFDEPTNPDAVSPGSPPAAKTPEPGVPRPLANPPQRASPSGGVAPIINPPGAAPPGSGMTLSGITAAVANTFPDGTTLPLPLRKRPLPEDDPFDATGIRAGSFILRPAIEATGGYDTNPSRVPGGQGSAYYIVAPELTVRSDFEQHQLNADIKSSYSQYPAVSFANRPNVDAKVDGRIDVNRDTNLDLEGRYLLSTDYPGSPNIPVGVAQLPVFQRPGATAGVTERFGRLEISLKGLVDRTVWQDSVLLDGSTSSNHDRDYTQYGAQLRGSFELTPGIKPFAEVDADTRRHDLPVDRSGDMRDSDGLTPKIGTTFELSRKLTGEISIGYVTRTFKDPTLTDVRGLIVDGSLTWTATALTTVKLTAKSTEDESVLPGVSGVLRRDAGLEVNHAFRRWLIGTVKLGYGLDDYVGMARIDNRYLASAALTYKLTRSVQIKGEVRQEWLRSNIPGTDYTATVALIGLRLQR